MDELITGGVIGAVAAKLFGKVGDVLAEDIAKVYVLGRDAIIKKAINKTSNIDDGAQVNLRIARDVFSNGSFSDEEICAEYFGGILASSRSEDGKDDSSMYFLDKIKSLSSNELKIHYIIYNVLNKLLINKSITINNINQGNDVKSVNIYLDVLEVISTSGLNENKLSSSCHILFSAGLINFFHINSYKLTDNRSIIYLHVKPTILGIQIYAVANNKQPNTYRSTS